MYEGDALKPAFTHKDQRNPKLVEAESIDRIDFFTSKSMWTTFLTCAEAAFTMLSTLLFSSNYFEGFLQGVP